MITANHIEGGWTELKGKINRTWGQLSEDELREFEGNVEQLVGMIQQKTGQAQEVIETRLAELDAQFRPMFQNLADQAMDYYSHSADAASQALEQARQSLAQGQAKANRMVKRRPMESVAVAFGAGIVAGALVALVARSK